MTLPGGLFRSFPALALFWAGAGFLGPGALVAQDTTLVADTAAVLDTLSAQALTPPDSLAPADTVVHALMALPGHRPDHDPALVARWDRDLLLRERAVTLLELLASQPGTIPLRTGDYGAPEGVVLDGMAGGRLRIFVDGVEEVAMDGSVVDLAQVTLAGIASVEVLRAGGELRILLTTQQPSVPSPVSSIEAGTGDLDTNIFRGSFFHPNAFGGGLSLLFERMDSDGRGGQEEGTLQSVWLRYVRPLGDRFQVAGEIRGRTAKSALERTVPEAARATRALRVRARLWEGVAVEAFAAQNNLDLTSGLSRVDSMVVDTVTSDTTIVVLYEPEKDRSTQFGGRLGVDLGPVWGQASFRHIDRPIRASLTRTDVDLGATHPGLGGLSGRLGWDREDGESRVAWGVSGWTRPLLGVSLTASLDGGVRGWWDPAAPAPDSVTAGYPGQSDGTFVRAGARFALGPISVEGSWLRSEVDSVLPLGNRVDQGVEAFEGDRADGFVVAGSVALPVEGFALQGSLEQWETEGLLRPSQIYRGGLTFHDTFYPTGNLEITAGFLVEGRDPMLLPIRDPASGGPVRVPFYQSWNAHIQIRVVTVRAFIRWDNLFLRPENQDLPGRLLPRTRAMFGVRWTLTN
ncbi:MAG: TonB-dependent receptor plug domain-containing protein [Gemmatimonadales bacterium]|nr:MAG: TonB-dependent receptor plug domain-containing protein [Gemmatimonadales bacterium]